MSTAAFAVKSGTGLSYAFMRSKGKSLKFMILVSFMAGYGLVFSMAGVILLHVDFMARLDLVQEFFKSGMTLHFVFAGLLLFWGLALLKQNPENLQTTRIWIALLIPCPVCFSVILLSCGFVTALYPGQILVFPILYAGFLLLSLAVALIGSCLMKNNHFTEHRLGTIMVAIAVYFLLSVILVPQFSDLDKVYRISRAETDFHYTPVKAIVILLCTAALSWGFFNPFKRKN